MQGLELKSVNRRGKIDKKCSESERLTTPDTPNQVLILPDRAFKTSVIRRGRAFLRKSRQDPDTLSLT